MSINVVLVACYGLMQPPNAEPLAIECLAAALRNRFEGKINIHQYLLRENNDALGDELNTKISKISQVDILGISIPQSCFYLSCNFIRKFTEINRNAQIVLGHALPAHNPNIFLDAFPNALIVRGWGEDAICEIVEQKTQNTKDWSKISNIAFLENDHVIMTSGEWPIPKYSPVRLNHIEYFPRIESSRGCHYDVCTFCTRPFRMKNSKKWFRFPTEKTISEIKELRRKDRDKESDFTFTDEDFIGNDLDGAEILANELLKIKNIKFSISIRVDNVFNPNEPPEMYAHRLRVFQKLKQAGLSLVYFGAESFSNTQLRRYGKGVKVADSIKAINSILDLNISVELGYILFDPLLSIDEFTENIEWLDKSSLWVYVGQLFNNLRVQKDSGFETILKSKNLLGEFYPNTMEFKYYFADTIINEIAHDCLTWKDEIDEVYSLARNVQRTNFKSSASTIFVNEYRKLEFLILKSISNNIKSNKGNFMTSAFHRHRIELVVKLSNELIAQNLLSNSEKALLFATQKFLNKSNKSPGILFTSK
jgi:radical SAM superfamily enzyme YgiQ (UPF0313 family)